MSGRVLGGKYILEQEIARGGMGEIWAALDERLRRRVAVKLMRVEYASSQEACRRFEQEARSIAQFRNPFVVQVHDYGIDGQPYIVMELLEGEDLEQRLLREHRLSLPAATVLVTQVARALGAAHMAGIVHRDLKPQNIFLAREETGESVKVLDFGLAALLREPSNTSPSGRSGQVLGTPGYMSPEQVCGSEHLDHRSDLWSLAVIAYQALTGTLPFSGSSFSDLLVRICLDPITPPSHLVPDLPAAVDAFFDRALAKDPERRFPSAQELAAAFASLAEGDGGPVRILVVDDEPDAAVLIQQRFRQQIRSGAYSFVCVLDGHSALDELRRCPDIDVALVDINMPGMDGLTLLARMGEVSPFLKVVIVSAYSDMANLRTAMNRGAFDFLVKPVDWKDLELTLEKTIRHVRALRQSMRFTEENTLLRMFVGHGVMDRLLPMLRAAGAIASEAMEATVCFLEVRGVLEAGRGLPPDGVVRLLNRCFEEVVPELVARKGQVERFTGCAVMAVFRGHGHLGRALDGGLASRARLAAHVARAGGSGPGLAIGLCSGEVISGGVGSRAIGRLDYTVLGEAVEVAARLCQTARPGQLLACGRLDDTWEGCYETEPLDEAALGRDELRIAAYSVRGCRSELLSAKGQTPDLARGRGA